MYIHIYDSTDHQTNPQLNHFTHTHSALLPDLATLSGNDFFAPTDPLSGQSRGFVKRPTVPLQVTRWGGSDGKG